MERVVYVIGHRNPDTDSVASAIAYATLKKALGMNGVVPAMAGPPNPQTRFVLERVGVPEPVYLPDVHPKVRDVLHREPATVTFCETVYEALQKFQSNQVRTLPVVDAERRPQAKISLLKLSEALLLPCPEQQRIVTTTVNALTRILGGRIIAGEADDTPVVMKLFVGAMSEEAFSDRVQEFKPEELLVITGNLRSMHEAAIEKKVRLLVITGGYTPDPQVVKSAGEEGVTILITAHDTAAAGWLTRLSTPLSVMAEKTFTTIGTGEPLSQLRQKLLSSGEAAIFAVEEDGKLAGVATKSSVMAPGRHGLILVDHNEVGQAVPGADTVEIIEVIDHHKLGNSPSSAPISFITAPVGSTCTLVAMRYRDSRIMPDKKTASLLLAGILSDTVIFKSPTTTEQDREIAGWLEGVAGVDANEFGNEMFAASSSLRNHPTAKDAVMADFKVFSHEGKNIGIGQVEVVCFDDFHEMKHGLLEALITVKMQENLLIAGLMVTDITSENSLFLVEGYTKIAHLIDYPEIEPHLFELEGVMSRKKQLVPHLLRIMTTIDRPL